MLVVSRKAGEEILLPSLGVTIRIADTKKSKVQIAIDAPEKVQILRGEKLDGPMPSSASRSVRSEPVGEPPEVREATAGYRIASKPARPSVAQVAYGLVAGPEFSRRLFCATPAPGGF